MNHFKIHEPISKNHELNFLKRESFHKRVNVSKNIKIKHKEKPKKENRKRKPKKKKENRKKNEKNITRELGRPNRGSPVRCRSASAALSGVYQFRGVRARRDQTVASSTTLGLFLVFSIFIFCAFVHTLSPYMGPIKLPM